MKSIRFAVFLAGAQFCLVPLASGQPQDDAAATQFRVSVEAACNAAASAALDDVKATVDPFGSQNYGLALVSGIEKGTRNTRSVICAYDRQSRQAEVGTLLDLGDAKDALADFPVGSEDAPPATAATLIYPGSVTCGQNCLAHWTALSSPDQQQLSALPEQVRRTLDEAKPGAGEAAPVAEARAAARAIVAAAGGRPDSDTAPDLAGVPTGARTCTHYWFGYMGESARVADRFDCNVERLQNGGLNVTRTSGSERLAYQVQMLGPGLAVIGGRNAPGGPPPGGYDLSRPLDPADSNYGNQVGLGIARKDGRFFAASIDEKGIEPKDPNFFQMVVVDPPRKGAGK